jgi:BCD family chlorophyll transporter-like MFS transporter
MIKTLGIVVQTLRLALPKAGIGWMFALLTIDFNRIAIVELGVTAVLVTTMLAMHYFFSPFQVIFGRIADRKPIAGYRRTPYMILSAFVSSILFIALPSVAEAMGAGSFSAIIVGFSLFVVFGIAMAMLGDSYHSLIAEVTTERTRSSVISVVWIIAILSTIVAAVVMNTVRPEYTPEAMQTLYNLTPFVVMGTMLIGILGIEKRLNNDEIEAYQERAKAVAPQGNPIAVAVQLLRENPETRGFFIFILISIFAIFLQDNILEVFGAEVFGMTVAETTRFQPTWGGGVLLGMVVMGVLSGVMSISKKKMALVGCVGTAIGMAILAGSAFFEQQSVVLPALFVMGMFTGAFNVGALSMMMDMTVEGATGLYMGLWGVAQAFGTGMSSVTSGALHTGFIESGLLAPQAAYTLIFVAEAGFLIAAAAVLYGVSIKRFRESHGISLSREDFTRAMESGAVA